VPTALITGVGGQDGSYLAEFLLKRGYFVHGALRRTSLSNTERLTDARNNPEWADRLKLHTADVTDAMNMLRLIEATEPDEIYNLAAQSHVGVSFDLPEQTLRATGMGPLNILEAVRQSGCGAKVYQASSSEMFGSVSGPLNEQSPFNPRSPYASAKVLAHFLVGVYRQAYQLFAVSGILFNHESARRGKDFVTRKISLAAAKIAAGQADELPLGNLAARRDWGFAGDYVEAMWLMLQQPEPRDYVIGTGVSHSVQDFCQKAFDCLDLDWRDYVSYDSSLVRPADVPELTADPARALSDLSWKPTVDFDGLVEMMVEADAAALRGQLSH